MSNLLLVHGAWGGAWEFQNVLAGLKKQGHNAVAIDLPGHGQSPAPIAKVTMSAYVQRVIDAVESMEGPVVLVGHSLGGAIISQVAEKIPTDLERLIFVAALLPKNGEAPIDLMKSDEDGELLSKLIFSADGSYATVAPNDIQRVLLNDIEASERLDHFTEQLSIQQSVEPFMAASELTEGAFGSVPKTYVRAALDKVLSPALQGRMISNWKVEKVCTLESGHYPLLSNPDELIEVLGQGARVPTAQG